MTDYLEAIVGNIALNNTGTAEPPPPVRLAILATMLAGSALSLSACGHSPGTRAVTGGLLGAGAGAAVGGLAGGNAGTGALIGAGVGAAGGAATAP